MLNVIYAERRGAVFAQKRFLITQSRQFFAI